MYRSMQASKQASKTLTLRVAPSETGGFIGVQAIRLKKYGAMKAEAGEEM